MNKEQASRLEEKCSVEKIWSRLKLVTKIWCTCFDEAVVRPEQIEHFCDELLGDLMVTHDKGEKIKLFPETSRGAIFCYTLLRRAMDMSGIGFNCVIGEVKAMTIYQDGTIKIEYRRRNRRTDWVDDSNFADWVTRYQRKIEGLELSS